MERQPEAVGQAQRAGPGVPVGVRVDRDIEQREVRESRVAICRIDPSAPNAGLQTVGDLQPPDNRDPGTRLNDQSKNASSRPADFVLINSGERRCPIEDQAHARPASR